MTACHHWLIFLFKSSRLFCLSAQHCFCQALHIDMKDKNSFGNIGMLCINFLSLDAAGEAFDCLTQIADTPIMWIGRGLAHEVLARKESSFSEQDIHFMNAADAYRAALQVNQNPAALLGLRYAHLFVFFFFSAPIMHVPLKLSFLNAISSHPHGVLIA